MSDGAHRGIGAERALETILGGKRPPSKKEEETREQVRARLAKAASPDGASPTSYGAAADAIAKAFLAVIAEEPEEKARRPVLPKASDEDKKKPDEAHKRVPLEGKKTPGSAEGS